LQAAFFPSPCCRSCKAAAGRQTTQQQLMCGRLSEQEKHTKATCCCLFGCLSNVGKHCSLQRDDYCPTSSQHMPGHMAVFWQFSD
jgi:hypothetical protein